MLKIDMHNNMINKIIFFLFGFKKSFNWIFDSFSINSPLTLLYIKPVTKEPTTLPTIPTIVNIVVAKRNINSMLALKVSLDSDEENKILVSIGKNMIIITKVIPIKIPPRNPVHIPFIKKI